MFEAVNAGDFPAVERFFADDVVLVLTGGAVTLAGDGAVGKKAFVRWFADWFRTFEPGYRFEMRDLRCEDDRVYVHVTHHARGRASGAQVTMRSSWVWVVRDGLIVRGEARDG